MSKYIARGNDITFRVTFYDVDNEVTAPSSAILWVSFLEDGVEAEDEIEMTSEGGGLFSATWDSSIADAGPVHWHARSSGPDKVAQDGSFTLVANDANPPPE